MLTILAHIIVVLGIAALAALIVYIAYISVKKFLSMIKERLAAKKGHTVAVGSMKRVMQEAVKEAEKSGNKKTLEDLEKMANSDGYIIAETDENDNIIKDSIQIYQTDEMDSGVYKMMGEEGFLAVTA